MAKKFKKVYHAITSSILRTVTGAVKTASIIIHWIKLRVSAMNMRLFHMVVASTLSQNNDVTFFADTQLATTR